VLYSDTSDNLNSILTFYPFINSSIKDLIVIIVSF